MRFLEKGSEERKLLPFPADEGNDASEALEVNEPAAATKSRAHRLRQRQTSTHPSFPHHPEVSW